MAMSQSYVQQEAAVSVQAMALGMAQDQAAGLARVMDASNVITDPTIGNYIDMSA